MSKTVRITLVAGAGFLAVCVSLLSIWRVDSVRNRLTAKLVDPAYLGANGPASDLLLCNPMGITIDWDGHLLVSDRGRGLRGRVVWRILGDGGVSPIAGTGRSGVPNVPDAASSSFRRPEGLAIGANRSLFLSDGFNHTVFRIKGDGSIRQYAGTGNAGFGGDGGPANEATLNRPAAIALDTSGNLYIADVQNQRIRKVDPAGVITTIAGSGEAGFSPDGTLASDSLLHDPWGIAVDHQDRLLIGDSANHRVRRIERDGRLATIAGTGIAGFSGDGGPATQAALNRPEALFVGQNGSVYIGDEDNHAVRVVDPEGNIWTVIGIGRAGRGTIGTPASEFAIDDPEGVVYRDGEVIITDGNNGRVLGVSAAGVVRNIAGRGTPEDCISLF